MNSGRLTVILVVAAIILLVAVAPLREAVLEAHATSRWDSSGITRSSGLRARAAQGARVLSFGRGTNIAGGTTNGGRLL